MDILPSFRGLALHFLVLVCCWSYPAPISGIVPGNYKNGAVASHPLGFLADSGVTWHRRRLQGFFTKKPAQTTPKPGTKTPAKSSPPPPAKAAAVGKGKAGPPAPRGKIPAKAPVATKPAAGKAPVPGKAPVGGKPAAGNVAATGKAAPAAPPKTPPAGTVRNAAPAPKGKPGFQPMLIGVGAANSGTSALATYIRSLSWILTADKKSTGYFDRVAATTAIQSLADMRDADATTLVRNYLNFWPHLRPLTSGVTCASLSCSMRATKPNSVAFEFSGDYMVDRRSAWALRSLLATQPKGSIKLLMLLRNPVDRAYAQYFQDGHKMIRDFTPTIKEEVDVLEACYEKAHMSLREKCKPGSLQHTSFQSCARSFVAKHIENQNPWFQWLEEKQAAATYAASVAAAKAAGKKKAPPPPECDAACEARLRKYQGLVLKSMYLDQIRNFICAGFPADDIIVVTHGELLAEPKNVLHRIADHMGLPLKFVSPKLEKDVESGAIHGMMHTTQGSVPKEAREFLNRYFEVHNRNLLRLLMSRNFNINGHYLAKEFE
eukprot:jgi/Mesvir1/18829/Mv11430-RA.1